jgi:hypothetical protein
MDALVQRIADGRDVPAQMRALTTLANLCATDRADIRQRAADAGAVEALVRLVRPSARRAVRGSVRPGQHLL